MICDIIVHASQAISTDLFSNLVYDVTQQQQYQYMEDVSYYQKYLYFEDSLRIDQGDNCAICRAGYGNGPMFTQPLQILRCGHVFHTACIQRNENIRWAQNLVIDCPKCRRDYGPYEKVDYHPHYYESLPLYLRARACWRYPDDMIMHEYWESLSPYYDLYSTKRPEDKPRLMLNLFVSLLLLLWNCFKLIACPIMEILVAFIKIVICAVDHLILAFLRNKSNTENQIFFPPNDEFFVPGIIN